MSAERTLYRYGPLAWVWRVLIAFFLLGGFGSLAGVVRTGELWLVVSALVLLAPALFFGFVVAVRVDHAGEDTIIVRTLLFWSRRIRQDELRSSRVRERYEGEFGPIHAPRSWVPVKGSLPIYLDLLAHIPDQRAFDNTFDLRRPPNGSSGGRA